MAIVEGPVADAEVLANTTTDGHQQSAQVAFEPDGDYVVVWHHVSNFSGPLIEGIRMQRYNASGEAQGGETTLVSNARLPNIVMDGAGNYLITYTRSDGSRGAQWYNNDGSTRGSEFTIDSTRLIGDEISVDADGDLAVVWMASGTVFPGFEARVSLYDANGVKKGNDFAISAVPDSRIVKPKVAMDDNGNLIVGYVSSASGPVSPGFGELFLQRFTATGVRQGGPIQVFPGRTDTFSIDAAPNGDVVVAYIGEPDRTWLSALSIARFNASGIPQGSRMLVTDHASSSYGLRVAVDLDGDSVVAYTGFLSSPENQHDIFARRYLADGTSQTDEFRVNQTTAGGQLYPSLAASLAGHFTVVWSSADGNSVGAFVRHYTIGNNNAATATNDAYTVNQDGMLVVSVSQGVLQNDRETDGDGANSDFDADGTPDVTDSDDDNDGIDDALDGLAGRVEPKLVTLPSHGVVYLDPDGSFQYTPYAGYLGPDSFTYYVVEPADGTTSNVATVSLNVAPLAGRSSFAGQNVVVPASAGAYTFTNWALFRPGPGGPYAPSYTVSNASDPGLFAVLPTVDAVGTLSFNLAGVAGTTSFDVTLDDGSGGSETQTFLLHVGNTTSEAGPIVFSAGSVDVSGGSTSFDVIEVSGLARPGEVAIDGSAGQWRIYGVTGSVTIRVQDGGSIVDVHDLFLAGSFSYYGGEGADHLLSGTNGIVSPGQSFIVATYGGNDVVDCINTYVGGGGLFDSGDGDDILRLFDPLAAPRQFTLSYSAVLGAQVVAGEGNDFVLARYAFVLGSFILYGMGGNDYLQVWGTAVNGELSVNGSAGHDACIVDTNYVPGALSIFGEEGADYILAANNIHAQGDVLIDGEAGADFIEVRNISADQLSVAGDAGDDAVDLKYSVLQLLYADLGEGNDLLTLTSNTITGSLLLDGGNGVDWLLDLGGSYPAASSRFGWELF
jgi:hypothetical protein